MFFILYAPSLWDAPYGPVIDGIAPSAITFISESHHYIGSQLFKPLISAIPNTIDLNLKHKAFIWT
jgi:hypothetical protein